MTGTLLLPKLAWRHGPLTKYVHDAVSEAFSVSNLPIIRFGDIQCVSSNCFAELDVTVYYFSNPNHPSTKRQYRLLWKTKSVVGSFVGVICGKGTNIYEGKLGWPFGTYFFYVYFCGPNSITDTGIGHLIEHMDEQSLKNGFISTYRSTVFVRRTDDYRLELSIPVNEQSANLSGRWWSSSRQKHHRVRFRRSGTFVCLLSWGHTWNTGYKSSYEGEIRGWVCSNCQMLVPRAKAI